MNKVAYFVFVFLLKMRSKSRHGWCYLSWIHERFLLLERETNTHKSCAHFHKLVGLMVIDVTVCYNKQKKYIRFKRAE